MENFYNAPHEVTDIDKHDAMVAAIKAGEKMSPVVVIGEQAFTGSHRIAAYITARELAEECDTGEWEGADLEIPAIGIDDETYRAAADALGVEHLEEWHDFNDVAEAIYYATEDEEVKDALSDQ